MIFFVKREPHLKIKLDAPFKLQIIINCIQTETPQKARRKIYKGIRVSSHTDIEWCFPVERVSSVEVVSGNILTLNGVLL